MPFRESSLSTVGASATQRKQAYAAILLSGLGFVVLAPFAKARLPEVFAFIPAYQSALVALSVLTAVVLFGQFHALRLRSLFVLACGYLFTAFAGAWHMGTFPGLFSANGLFGSRAQTTAWMYMFWHGTFPLFVIVYAWLRDREAEGYSTVSASLTAMVVGSGAVFALSGAY